jgi:hypothetical protein
MRPNSSSDIFHAILVHNSSSRAHERSDERANLDARRHAKAMGSDKRRPGYRGEVELRSFAFGRGERRYPSRDILPPGSSASLTKWILPNRKKALDLPLLVDYVARCLRREVDKN